jgi:GntR family transcriptional regulator
MKLSPGVLPKYRQLLQLIRTRILSGELPPGARLPTEDELMQTYGLARGTVRKAIEQLGAEGLVQTIQGSGSFVSTVHPYALPFRFAASNGDPAETFRVITKAIVPASMSIAERLALPLGEPLIHIARLRLVGGAAVGFSERFLPLTLCPDLLDEDLTRSSIHAILVSRSELPLLRAVVEIEAQMLDEEDAALLQVAPKTPAIVITRLTYTAPTRPAVWYRGLYRHHYALSVYVDAMSAPQA